MSGEVRRYAACVWVTSQRGLGTAPFQVQRVDAYTAADAVTQCQLQPDVADDVRCRDGRLEVVPDPEGEVERGWQEHHSRCMRWAAEDRSG